MMCDYFLLCLSKDKSWTGNEWDSQESLKLCRYIIPELERFLDFNSFFTCCPLIPSFTFLGNDHNLFPLCVSRRLHLKFSDNLLTKVLPCIHFIPVVKSHLQHFTQVFDFADLKFLKMEKYKIIKLLSKIIIQNSATGNVLGLASSK